MNDTYGLLANLMPPPQTIDGAYVSQMAADLFTVCSYRPDTLVMDPAVFRRVYREIKRVTGVKGRFGKRTVLFRYDADRLRVKPL